MLKTKTFSVSWNRNGFTLAESQTRKSGTIAPLLQTMVSLSCFHIHLWGKNKEIIRHFGLVELRLTLEKGSNVKLTLGKGFTANDLL